MLIRRGNQTARRTVEADELAVGSGQQLFFVLEVTWRSEEEVIHISGAAHAKREPALLWIFGL